MSFVPMASVINPLKLSVLMISPRSKFSAVRRLMIYFAVQGLLLAVYVWVVQKTGYKRLGELRLDDLLRENEWLEWIQIAVLFVTASLLCGAFRSGQPLLHRILALLVLCAALRELDSVLEDVLFDKAHWVFILIVIGAMAVMIRKDFSAFQGEIVGFISRPGFYLMFFGMAFVVIYAQIFGQREVWRVLANAKYQSETKRFIEEGLEFMGYLLIAFGVIEERFFSGSDNRDRSSRSNSGRSNSEPNA